MGGKGWVLFAPHVMAVWLAMTFCWAIINIRFGKMVKGATGQLPFELNVHNFRMGYHLRNCLNGLLSHLQYVHICRWGAGVLCHFMWHPKSPIFLSPNRSLHLQLNISRVRIFLPRGWLSALNSRSGNYGWQLLTIQSSYFSQRTNLWTIALSWLRDAVVKTYRKDQKGWDF